jgi:tRNA G10  N-methylase Trm11
MVNLAACTPGSVLLDPFCGVGQILQEGLLAKADVLGVDTNPWCVKAATENLDWLIREYALGEATFRVLKGDALNLKSIVGSEVNCIVTEPDLGPPLRDLPTVPYAEKIIHKLNPLYSSFLEASFNILKKNGRLVLVTPYLKTRSGKPVTMRIEERAEKAGFIRVFPFGDKAIFGEAINIKENMGRMRFFVDVAERHKTGREIHVFQK